MIKVLPTHISNLIAAGEVVQRPSSVVKELMENSIDAGAENISVIISDSGRTLIQVIDDGVGMSEEEAKLSFSRHATSKISSAEDLQSILTYGFRGEALPSIASVAEVSLKTKKRDMEIGTEVVMAESNFISQEAVSCADGTNISVRNIFYNLPARRKFLKTDAAEFRQIVSEFCRIALCHYEVSMKLIHNKREIFVLKGTQNLKQRISEVAGKEILKELVDIKTETSIVSISGFIGKPECVRKNGVNQYFFVNGRFFKSPYLHKAITKGYEKLILDGYTPSYFIFMEIDPTQIDINIHPSKTEVKFEEDSMVFEILHAAVRESLGMNGLGPTIDFNMEGSPEIPIPNKAGVYTPPPKIDFNPLFNPFDQAPVTTEYPIKEHRETPLGNYQIEREQTKSVDGYGEIFEERMYDSRAFLQIQGKYLITPVKSGLLLINIHRAKERVLYEKYLKKLDDYTPLPQENLFPTVIEYDTISYSVLEEAKEFLPQIGFDIEFCPPASITVKGVPEGYSIDVPSVKASIDELISTLSTFGLNGLTKADTRHDLAVSLSKTGARGALKPLSHIEAQVLIDSLFSCADAERTPDGRTCMSILSVDELEKKF